MESNKINENCNINLKKTSNKNNFLIFNNNQIINLNLNNVFLKFGIEDYNKKKILNLFINMDNSVDNDNYNNKINLINIVNQIKNLKNDNLKSNIYNLSNKEFDNPIKIDEKFGTNIIVLRTYLDYNYSIKMEGILGELEQNTNISNYYANINISIKTVWTTHNNFGLIIYTNHINLLKKFE